MRFRNIWDYLQESPLNTNPAILQQMVDQYATDKANPLSQYDLDVDISNSTDLLGKYIWQLQSDIQIIDGKFYGTLYHITDYTGFDVNLCEGYYVAFHVAYEGADAIKVNGQTLDEDGIMVIRLRDIRKPGKAYVEIIDGENSYTDEISFGGLKFSTATPIEPEEEEIIESPIENIE